MNPLLDLDFLKKLDQQTEQTKYAKIILLNLNEEPVKEFQGKITQGNLNIDGNSAVRRTCSLTMVTDEAEDLDIYLRLKNKFKLAVGVENHIDQRYPEIIWFPQGYYVFSSLNINTNLNGYSITLQGKDKMCLLNGELGGTLTSEVDFGKYDWIDKDNIKHYEDIPIKNIVRNIVAIFGQIPYHKIILNDIDSYAVELLKYKGDEPLYLLKDTSNNTISNMTFKGDFQVYISNEKININNEGKITYDSFTSAAEKDKTPTEVKLFVGEETSYTIIKITTDQEVGYRPTALTCPGDLIAKVGETITSVLDKIKNTFADFEYFFDEDGNFIFQKKRTYVNTKWNSLINSTEGIYANPNAYSSSIAYSFEGNGLLSAISNQPNIMNIKNDYSIWGVRKSSSGAEVPVHMRYAIMKKPIRYTTIRNEDNITYYATGQKKYDVAIQDTKLKKVVDWRELIYQMSLDYYNGTSGFESKDFLSKIANNNPDEYPTGITGYESFYADMQAFWRQLYNPGDGWVQDVSVNPSALNFWIDFLDTDGEFGKYSIQAIGQRQKVINDNKITSVYFKDVPNVMFVDNIDDLNLTDLTGYTRINMPSQYSSYFAISARKKSAKDELDSLLYQYLYATETINLTTLPIYYLQPNTRILVNDIKTKLNGEYILTRITLPLAYNGTSSLNATKAVERIY